MPANGSWFEGGGVWSVGDLHRQIEIFEDAVEERERPLNLDLDVEELAEREEEAALQCGKGDDVANAHAAIPVDDLPPRIPINHRWRDREKRSNDHEEPAADHLLPDL